MHLMKDRKLLDARVFNGRHEIEFLTFNVVYLELKIMHCSTSFSRKKDSKF